MSFNLYFGFTGTGIIHPFVIIIIIRGCTVPNFLIGGLFGFSIDTFIYGRVPILYHG